jgi:hypothetical protein
LLRKNKVQGLSIEKAWAGDVPPPVSDEPEFWTILKTPSPKYRQLSAQWTVELPKDLIAMHSTDVEEELSAIISKHIADEIDAELMRSLK